MKRLLSCIAILVLALTILHAALFFLIPLPRFDTPQSRIFLDSSNRMLRLELAVDHSYRLGMQEIPPMVRSSVLALEDQYFYWHPGINPFAVIRAIWHNLTSTKAVGASTISMQVARLSLRLKRTIPNKVYEMLLALRLEMSYSKEEILRLWLDLTPYGFNIVGFHTAAFLYFNQSPDNLSTGQIAFLVSLPKNPSPKAAHLQRSMNRVLSSLRKQGLIHADEFTAAARESSASRFFGKSGRLKRPDQPPRAMHYLRWIQARARPEERVISTTLDWNLQMELELSLRDNVRRFQHQGVTHSAGAIIGVTDGSIRAWAGSHDFLGPAGQNDVLLSLRSPGSTLKPFVAIEALNQGIATMESMLLDIPQSFHGYFPRNFDEGFRGAVSLSDALRLSLNLPFVELEGELERGLYDILKLASFEGLRSRSHYGQSLVLGGGSLRPWDLLRLYHSLPSRGLIRDGARQFRLFEPEGVLLVEQVLSTIPLPRPVLFDSWQSESFPVVMKTGTSDQSRDLYCVAYTGDFTVLLWMGRFDGRPTSVAEARSTIALTMMSLMKRLPRIQSMNAVKARLDTAPMCREPRFISRNHCLSMQPVTIIPGTTRLDYCPPLRPEQIVWYGLNSARRSCYSSEELVLPPLIIEPASTEVVVRNGDPIAIRCVSPDSANLTVYVDQEQIGSVQSTEPVWVRLSQGSHRIACASDNGKVNSIHIEVTVE